VLQVEQLCFARQLDTFQGMQEATASPLPPSIDRVLRLFRSMGREEKMQALVQYSKKLEPFPERFNDLDRTKFNIPECQTRVDIVPELKNGKLHFYADLNARQSPTIAAVLAIVFGAVNDQPPETTLAIPSDFVRIMMESIGLGVREPGLNAMIVRLKRHALEAQAVMAGASA
jgi:cysteine desulfuration protein SufE